MFLYIIDTIEFIRLVAIMCKKNSLAEAFSYSYFFCKGPAASGRERRAVRCQKQSIAKSIPIALAKNFLRKEISYIPTPALPLQKGREFLTQGKGRAVGSG